MQEIVKSEALMNEIKGTLFEFLVASQIAIKFNIEGKYLSCIDPQLLETLKRYELYLRENNFELFSSLPSAAQKVAVNIINMNLIKTENIHLVGKGINGEYFNEADFVMLGENKSLPISLKLIKSNSFINTKSAGIRTFIEKYFCKFESSIKTQRKLNHLLDMSFSKMGGSLYSMIDLDFDTKFCNRWTELGYSELPGELNSEMKSHVKVFYNEIICFLYESLLSLKNENEELFFESLLPLLGMGDKKIIQVICNLDKIKSNKYQYNGVHVFDYKYFMNLFNTVAIVRSKSTSSFSILLDGLNLQIRVKPMNKFTTPAVKINCSIKIS